jgi:hypothetical protein
MKIIKSIAFIILMTFSLSSQQKGFGIGIIVGEPTGLSLKGWLSSTSAIDDGTCRVVCKPRLASCSCGIPASYL